MRNSNKERKKKKKKTKKIGKTASNVFLGCFNFK